MDPLTNADSNGLSTPIEPTIELRGRLRRTVNGDRFRVYVQTYGIPEEFQIELLGRALKRNEKVRIIVNSRYSTPLDRPEIKSWVDSSVEAIEELLPSVKPLRLPTHFLKAGFEIDGEDRSFYKMFMNLDRGILPPEDCAEKIAYICFHWGDTHEDINLDSDQDWILDCIASQWRLLRRVAPDLAPASPVQ
jgi:phosphatidylserine/phosphatidylglycerophosphate/cardiolipin synthase-like enzyme